MKNDKNSTSDTLAKTRSAASEKVSLPLNVDGDQGMSRRTFLVLSTIAASGGLAAFLLRKQLRPLQSLSKEATLLSTPRYRASPAMLITPVESSLSSTLNPSIIPKFENQLTAPPPVFQPTVITTNGTATRHDYLVSMTSFQQQILPASMNMLTPVWGYSGMAQDSLTGASLGIVQSAPGPTFEAVRGIPIKVTWQNNITSPFFLPVDPTIHWANPNGIPVPNAPYATYPPGYSNAQVTVPLVTHLHGGQNQSTSDGGPNQWFTSTGKYGSSYYTYEKTNSNAAVYYYPNTQQPTTLWYHDHALGLTRLNVASGLAGFYLLRSPNDGSDKVSSLLPSGKYEMPLVVQDRTFNPDGSFYYPTVSSVPDVHPFWVNMFMGATIMVNGKVWPNMNVDRGQYRLRFLNGSNSRIYDLAFSNNLPFTQIGSDGGYLQKTVELSSLILAPAERADVIVDFSNLAAGEQVVLQNNGGETRDLTQVMQFTANSTKGTSVFNFNDLPTPFNPTLPGSTFPTLPKPAKRRILTLYEISDANGTPSEALLDGQMWDAAISEMPELGSTEEWILINPSMDHHPIHLHLVQFQLVSRQTLDASTAYLNDWISLNGKPPFNHPTKNLPSLQPYILSTLTLPAPQEQCWKDTIIVGSGEVVTIRVRFAPQDGSAFPFDATSGPGYVWHCHLLEHEDNEMMRPYKVTSQSLNSLALPIAAAVAGGAGAGLALKYYFGRKRKNRYQNTSAEKTVSEGQAEASQREAPE